jgi:hypothetical protein
VWDVAKLKEVLDNQNTFSKAIDNKKLVVSLKLYLAGINPK